MQTRPPSVRKVTISLPPSLLEFTDRQAVQLKISRSEIISLALAQVKATETSGWPPKGIVSILRSERIRGRFKRAPSRRSWTMPVSAVKIHRVEFDPVKGSEQGGLRPALIVQNDTGNRYSATTVIAAITRDHATAALPVRGGD